MDNINYIALYNGFKHVNNYLSYGKGITALRIYVKGKRDTFESNSVVINGRVFKAVKHTLIVPPKSKYILTK